MILYCVLIPSNLKDGESMGGCLLEEVQTLNGKSSSLMNTPTMARNPESAKIEARDGKWRLLG
jgi:hypothetical protein